MVTRSASIRCPEVPFTGLERGNLKRGSCLEIAYKSFLAHL